MIDPAGTARPGDETTLAVVHSPGFDTRPPRFTAAELIPASVWQACSAWDRGRIAPRDVVIRLVRDVIVAAEGLVFDRNGAILHYSIRQHEPDLIDRAAHAVRLVLAGEPARRHDLPLVLGKKRGAGNYGHWMIEMLPMLHLALSRLSDERIGVLVHDVTDPMLGRIMQQTLRRLGIADHRVRVSGLEPVFVRELIMVEGLTDHGVYMSPLVCDCHARLAHGISGSGIERVFLHRGAGTSRSFGDPVRMMQMAAARGFSVVSPGVLGLDEQIALMRDARVVAGVMGAAMTNLIYASEGTRAALFTPAMMPDTFFWFISNLRGLPYHEIRCEQSGPGEGRDGRLDLGFRAFRRALDQEIASL